MNSLRIFLLAALIFVVFGNGEVEAETELEWNYSTGGGALKVAVSADGEYIAAGSRDGSEVGHVYLFHKDSSTPLWNYTTGDRVSAISISADGEYIAVGTSSYERKVYLFHKDSSTPLWSYELSSSVSVAISADGEYIVAGSGMSWLAENGNAGVYLFHKDSGYPLWSCFIAKDYDSASAATVYAVAISEDGEYIAAGSGDGDYQIYLFHKSSNDPLWSYAVGGTDSYTTAVLGVAISADGEYIAVGTTRGNSQSYCEDCSDVYLFHKDSSIPLWRNSTLEGSVGVAISADGEYIAAVSTEWETDEGEVYLFHKSNSTPLWNYTIWENFRAISISADGEYITVGSGANSGDTGEVYLFNNYSSTPLWNYTTSSCCTEIAISADGKYIVVAGFDETGFFEYSNGKLYLFDRDKDRIPPIASFSWSYTNYDNVTHWYEEGENIAGVSIVGSPTHFNASSSYDNSGDSLTYFWDFGDGTNGTGVMVNHTFNNFQDNGFDVVLTVTDSAGNQDIISYNIKPAPAAVPGCMDSTANNFNADANEDDGSCTFDAEPEVEEEKEDKTDDEGTLAGQCTCPDGSKGQMVGPADDDGVDDGCLCSDGGDESPLPSVSMIPVLITIGFLAIYRRK